MLTYFVGFRSFKLRSCCGITFGIVFSCVASCSPDLRQLYLEIRSEGASNPGKIACIGRYVRVCNVLSAHVWLGAMFMRSTCTACEWGGGQSHLLCRRLAAIVCVQQCACSRRRGQLVFQFSVPSAVLTTNAHHHCRGRALAGTW